MNRKRKIVLLLLVLGSFCLPGQVADPDFLDFSKTDRAKVPEIYRWNLEEIFRSPEEWQKALAEAEAQLKIFKSRLDGWVNGSDWLAESLEMQESLQKKDGRLTAYAALGSQVAWSDPAFQNMNSLAMQFSADFSVQRSRLLEGIGRITEIETVLGAEARLQPFAVYIRELMLGKKHELSLELEETLSKMQVFSNGPRNAADCLAKIDMPAAETKMPDGSRRVLSRPERMKLLQSNQAQDRKAAHEAGCLNRTQYENTFAALLDTCVKQDAFNARVRHHQDSLSAELFPYGVPATVYRNLVQTVKQNLGPYHRYLTLRKKVLGLNELHEYDQYLPLVPDRPLHYSYQDACRLLEESTRVLGGEYSAVLKQAYADRWIDAFGHKDKMNLGSAQSYPGLHPFVNLDYRGSFFDMITVAHELGHAISIHLPTLFQPFSCSQINWFVSEVPSTFNEILVMRRLVKNSRDNREKLALLDELVRRLNLLLFDCVQGAEMQLAMHEHVEQGGALSPAWLNAKQLELTRRYKGHSQGVMVIDDYVKSEWNNHTTFFSAFQDYYYVVGSLVSLAMINRIDNTGTAAAKQYLQFLKAGGSRPIMDVLRDMGIDLASPKPVEYALKVIDDLVSEMEKLAR